ncbi:hypothetical protein VM98_34060, partial [Streptomyces rubellomurinus subsp. indigoferus]
MPRTAASQVAPGRAAPVGDDGYSADLGGPPTGGFGGIRTRRSLGVKPTTGRDLFGRMLRGGQVSVLISFTASGVVVATGTLAGIAAGYL